MASTHERDNLPPVCPPALDLESTLAQARLKTEQPGQEVRLWVLNCSNKGRVFDQLSVASMRARVGEYGTGLTSAELDAVTIYCCCCTLLHCASADESLEEQVLEGALGVREGGLFDDDLFLLRWLLVLALVGAAGYYHRRTELVGVA